MWIAATACAGLAVGCYVGWYAHKLLTNGMFGRSNI